MAKTTKAKKPAKKSPPKPRPQLSEDDLRQVSGGSKQPPTPPSLKRAIKLEGIEG